MTAMASEGVGKEASSLQEGEWTGKGGGGANTGGLERQGKSNDRHVPDSDLWKETSNQRIRCHVHPVPYLIQIYAHFSLYFLLPSLYFDLT